MIEWFKVTERLPELNKVYNKVTNEFSHYESDTVLVLHQKSKYCAERAKTDKLVNSGKGKGSWFIGNELESKITHWAIYNRPKN